MNKDVINKIIEEANKNPERDTITMLEVAMQAIEHRVLFLKALETLIMAKTLEDPQGAVIRTIQLKFQRRLQALFNTSSLATILLEPIINGDIQCRLDQDAKGHKRVITNEEVLQKYRINKYIKDFEQAFKIEYIKRVQAGSTTQELEPFKVYGRKCVENMQNGEYVYTHEPSEVLELFQNESKSDHNLDEPKEVDHIHDFSKHQ